jgi:hypothetical protein
MPTFLGFTLFQTLYIKWDFINNFYITLFQIRIKCDGTVLQDLTTKGLPEPMQFKITILCNNIQYYVSLQSHFLHSNAVCDLSYLLNKQICFYQLTQFTQNTLFLFTYILGRVYFCSTYMKFIFTELRTMDSIWQCLVNLYYSLLPTSLITRNSIWQCFVNPSYPLGTGSNFPGGKAAGAWSWPRTFIECQGQEWWSYTSTPHMSSQHIA